MPSIFGFATHLSKDPERKAATFKELRDYLLQEGLTEQQINDAQKAFNAKSVSSVDSTRISSSTHIAAVNNQTALPQTHAPPTTVETAASHPAPGPIRRNTRASQTQSEPSTSTSAPISRKAKPATAPRAKIKSTGRNVTASTLHFHQLVTDSVLQLGDELHVPLQAIKTQGAPRLVHNVVAIMVYQGSESLNSNWLVQCSARGGKAVSLTGSGPTDFAGQLKKMGFIGPAARNWSGKVRFVRNGRDLGTVTQFKSDCFS